MRRAIQWMFSRPEPPQNPLQVILWWEARRIPYNLVVGFAGAISLTLFYWLILTSPGDLAPGEDAVEPLALIAAPIAANLLYTAGWIVELLLRLVWRSKDIGPKLLRVGALFSLAVVALPSILWGAYRLLQIVGLV